MDLHVIILAGGVGRRLWPLSTPSKPKQFCNLIAQKSLLEETIERFNKLGQCFILTNQKYSTWSKKSSCKNILIEKKSLDTAHCLKEILQYFKHKDDTFLIVPADHFIEDPKPLLQAIKSVKINQKHLNLFALKANIAHTNLGYIKIASNSNEILAFKEKPNKTQAKQFINEGYYHNSGIILTSRKALESNLNRYAKHLFEQKDKKECFNKALLEKSKEIHAFRVDTPFLDLGTYKALTPFLQHKYLNDKHNCNTLIHATSRDVKSFGLKDIIIIESQDGVLAFHKDYLEKIDQLLK